MTYLDPKTFAPEPPNRAGLLVRLLRRLRPVAACETGSFTAMAGAAQGNLDAFRYVFCDSCRTIAADVWDAR